MQQLQPNTSGRQPPIMPGLAVATSRAAVAIIRAVWCTKRRGYGQAMLVQLAPLAALPCSWMCGLPENEQTPPLPQHRRESM